MTAVDFYQHDLNLFKKKKQKDLKDSRDDIVLWVEHEEII